MEHDKLFARKVVLDWAKMKHREYQETGVAGVSPEVALMANDFVEFVQELIQQFREFQTQVAVKSSKYMDENKAIEEIVGEYDGLHERC